MAVVFDNNFLSLLLNPGIVANDPETGKAVPRAQERIEHLVQTLKANGDRIVIPTPVLSEFLTFGDASFLEVISTSAHFEVVSFDLRAAIEAAATLKKAIKGGLGKKLGLLADWQKIKIDRQVVAIAKVASATVIYSTDNDVKALAADSGISVIHVADLPLPPSTTPLLDVADTADTSAAPTPAELASTKPPAPIKGISPKGVPKS